MRLFAVIGAGGFGREVMPIARRAIESALTDFTEPDDSELVFVDDGEHFADRVINGHRVMTMSEFAAHPSHEKRYNIAISGSKTRQRIAEQIDFATPFSIVSPTHERYDGNEVGEGAVFCGFTHVTSNAKVGKFFHCNLYSYVAHDCVIGDYVTFAPFVKCNGQVIVEDHAYIGAGAVIKQGGKEPIVIGEGAVIGIGAVVTKSVPPGTTVVGNPARPM
jgi:sugar O-acyltransferase (sialic acid O-acetyltransferase NeuD family)